MSILSQLTANKGTVSSALGKEFGAKVIAGNTVILTEAVKYVCFELDNPKAKNVRAGAAKILEITASKKPELVAPFLNELKPAFSVPEPQTRWMLMQVFGYCAKETPEVANSVTEFAKAYLSENAGVCLTGAVHLYLGRSGAVSKERAREVLPILDDALKTATVNEVDWILEAFIQIFDLLSDEEKELIIINSKQYTDAPKKSTQNRVKKILKKA